MLFKDESSGAIWDRIVVRKREVEEENSGEEGSSLFRSKEDAARVVDGMCTVPNGDDWHCRKWRRFHESKMSSSSEEDCGVIHLSGIILSHLSDFHIDETEGEFSGICNWIAVRGCFVQVIDLMRLN